MKKVLVILSLLGIILIIVLVIIFSFEFLSRKYSNYCRQFRDKILSCNELSTKYKAFDNGIPSLFYEIMSKRQKGQKVLKKEYEVLADALSIEVERKDIGGNNGLACGYYGYISEDLPGSAKDFVKRHELTHNLGITREFNANKEAALEYPFGFLETTILSFVKALTDSQHPFACRIVFIWNSFKIYFLPI